MDANPMGADDSFEHAVNRLKGHAASEQLPTEEPETNDEVESEETPQGDTEPQETKYKVKVRGEEHEVTIDDLLKSYMMESDYRVKTSETAEMKRELKEKLSDLDARYQEAKELLEAEREDLESDDMKLMKEIDPDWYYKKVENIDRREKRLAATLERRKEEAKAKHAENLAKAREELTRLVPDWLDSTKQAAESQDIVKIMTELGYKDDELNNITDPRVFALARKAMLFDKINKQDPGAKRVNTPTITAKPGAAQSKATVKSAEDKALQSRLKRTGSVEDAQALLKKYLGA